jgi:hypothetical protein
VISQTSIPVTPVPPQSDDVRHDSLQEIPFVQNFKRNYNVQKAFQEFLSLIKHIQSHLILLIWTILIILKSVWGNIDSTLARG